MTVEFVGRQREMAWLDAELERADRGSGRMMAVRGRRQVGKSRLISEWLERIGRRHLYYQARGTHPRVELESFTDAVRRSSLTELAGLVEAGVTWTSWDAALGTLARTLGNGPAPVVVIDEFPYLAGDQDTSIEGVLQAVWDHQLSTKPVLVILVGSDLTMMEAITTYGRPLYGRIDTPRTIDPLSIPEVAELLDVAPVDAIDTYLMVGGFPKVVAARAEHDTTDQLLQTAMADEAHPLVFTGQQTLAAEFPPDLSARAVLEAIGAGERTFGKILRRSGASERTVAESLKTLVAKGVVSAADPRAERVTSGRTRYAVADAYLRFWLRFIAGRTDDISRGAGDQVADDIREQWQPFAGRAVEPHVRAAIERLAAAGRFADVRRVGSYWTRRGDLEVDLVGTSGAGGGTVGLVGSVKWRGRRPFERADADDLLRDAQRVPGGGPATTTLAVSRTGFEQGLTIDVQLGPGDIVAALAG